MSGVRRLEPPSLVSTIELLATPGRCFYIPAYQRNFGWDKDNIERFFEDIARGVGEMMSSDNGAESSVAETFLGTVVCFNERYPYSSEFPHPDDLPEKIYSIIDGQQRLTVCLTTAMVLHSFLASNSKKLIVINNGEATKQFNDLKEVIKRDLYKMLAEHGLTTGDRRYYPRMIRGLEDCWSKEREKSKYVKSIGALCAEYIDHVNKDNGSQFEFSSDKDSASRDVKADIIYEYVNWLSLSKTEQKENESDNYAFESLPDIAKVFDSKSIQSDLFDHPGITLFSTLKTEIANTLGKSEQAKLNEALKAYESMAKVMTFSSYLLKRVKFILMVTTSENYALSIFDSLNTTGDPLTAFETFVPEVVKSFNPREEYKNSKARKMIDEIKRYLDVSSRARDTANRARDTVKQAKKTKELIVSFALAENGSKLPEELGVQRRYMLERYKKQVDKEHGLDYISNLLHVARVNEEFINKKASKKRLEFSECLAGLSEEQKLWSNDDLDHARLAGEAIFCLRFLIASGHKIVIPLITRFYALFEDSKNIPAHKDLCKAIRSTAAFFALWRSSRPDTDNIDNHHRRIMGNLLQEEPPQLNFARDLNGELDLARLQNEYCRLLVTHSKRAVVDDQADNKKQTLSREKWIELSHEMPIYASQKSVAKFIVILSSYWKVRNQAGSEGIISDVLWFHPAHETVEHIKPRSSPDADNIADKELLDSLGNLILLPGRVNALIKDARWDKRKLIYEILNIDNDKLEAEIQKRKLSVKQATQFRRLYKTFKDPHSGAYIPTLKSVAKYKSFGFKVIKSRSRKVLASAWEPLIEWLGGPPTIAPKVTLAVADQPLVVSWEAVELAEEYVIVVDPAADSGSPITVPADIPATRQTVTVSGLVNGTKYTIRVMGRNSFGEGPQSVRKKAVPAEVAAKR